MKLYNSSQKRKEQAAARAQAAALEEASKQATGEDDILADVPEEGPLDIVASHSSAADNTNRTADASCGPSFKVPCYLGLRTLIARGRLEIVTSVADDVFRLLLDLLTSPGVGTYKPRIYQADEMLLIFLLKIKFALPFSAVPLSTLT